MVESASSVWVTLIKAIIAGQRPNSKILKLYLFGAFLTLLTVFLALVEMVHSTMQPADEDNEQNVKPSRSPRSYLLTKRNNRSRLHASRY